MKTCAICGKPLNSGVVVHAECVPQATPEEFAADVRDWIDNRKNQYDSSATEGWREAYLEEHEVPIPDDPELAFDRGFNRGFEYGMKIALDDLIELIDSNGWSAFYGC